MKHQFNDPTYLRSTYDGLLSGTLHQKNASYLPTGLIGIYEEALTPLSNITDRQMFLDFFLVWALLKKEVSAVFVSQVLGWTEKRVLDYIALYSKWFNTPLTGKYVIYHERFRSFVIQKISHAQFSACNENIIKMGQKALEYRNGDEWEQYALEHLSTHLLIQSMDSKDATALKTQAYSTMHWNRQIEISKGFEWSKLMLNDMMLWASKYDEEEVIECALNKVDLYHLEQDDAPRIIELVSQNEIDLAIERIEKIGGDNRKGIQRRFILFLACLMELTLLKSRIQSFRYIAIKKLIQQIDNKIPKENLRFDTFFSSYLIFKIATEIAKLGLDYSVIIDRHENCLDADWIEGNGPYSDLQITILTQLIENTSLMWNKVDLYIKLGCELYQQGQLKQANLFYNKTKDFIENIESHHHFMSSDIRDLPKFQEVFQRLVVTKKNYSNHENEITKKYEKWGPFDSVLAWSNFLIKEMKIEDDEDNNVLENRLLNSIQESFGTIDFVEVPEMKNVEFKSYHTRYIIEQIAVYEKFEIALKVIYLNLKIDREVDNGSKYRYLSNLTKIFASNSRIDVSYELLNFINDDYWKAVALKELAIELIKLDRMSEAKELTENIGKLYPDLDAVIEEVCIELIRCDYFNEAIEIAREIIDDINWIKVMLKISAVFDIQDDWGIENILILEDVYECAKESVYGLMLFATELLNQNKVDWAKRIIVELSDKEKLSNNKYERTFELIAFSELLYKQNKVSEAHSKFQEAVKLATEIDEKHLRENLFNELIKHGKFIQDIEFAKEFNTRILFVNIGVELSKLNQWQQIEKVSSEISEPCIKDEYWQEISKKTYQNTNWSESFKIVFLLSNQKSKEAYLRALSNVILPFDVNYDDLRNAIILYQNDIGSLKKLLQVHAIKDLFTHSSLSQTFERFNRTLNLNWVVEIKNQVQLN